MLNAISFIHAKYHDENVEKLYHLLCGDEKKRAKWPWIKVMEMKLKLINGAKLGEMQLVMESQIPSKTLNEKLRLLTNDISYLL